MTKTAENHTLWGCTYLYNPYKWVPSGFWWLDLRSTTNSLSDDWTSVRLNLFMHSSKWFHTFNSNTEISFGIFFSSFLVYLPSSIFLMAFLLNPVKSSKGDKCRPFVVCMRECSKGCSLNEYPGKLPIYLTMFWWDCSDECKYQCMHNVTASDVRRNEHIKQFYGKVSIWQLKSCSVLLCLLYFLIIWWIILIYVYFLCFLIMSVEIFQNTF